MKKIISVLAIIFTGAFIFASGAKDNIYSPSSYFSAISRNLGHNLNENEQVIADTAYLYYYKKFDNSWDNANFDYSVEKGTDLCLNKAALLAAKMGLFGENFIQATIVTVGDAKKDFNKWLKYNSERYEKTH